MRPLEFLFVAALILYSLAIWSHKFTGRLKPWIMRIFGAGLGADILGTLFLCVASARSWKFTVHTVSGLVSLLIMALHFLWATLAIWKGGRAEAYFRRFSIWAWILWLIAFISGLPYISISK